MEDKYKEEISDQMEIFYQRDRQHTDRLFKEVMNEQNRIKILLNDVIKLLNKVI